MSRVLVLDDMDSRLERFRKVFDNSQHGVAYSKTAAKAIGLITAKKFDFMFLDHDLLPEHYGKDHLDPAHDSTTGYAVVKHLIDNVEPENWPMQIVIHSLNIKGVNRMADNLTTKTNIRVHTMPFDTLGFENLLNRIQTGKPPT
jgi:CheY-like chemotaxis protein